jgi:hypothetical protein
MENNINPQQLLLLGVKTSNSTMVQQAIKNGANLDSLIDEAIRTAIQNNNKQFISFLIETGYGEKINFSKALFLSAKHNNDWAFSFLSNIHPLDISLLSIVKSSTIEIQKTFTNKTGINSIN